MPRAQGLTLIEVLTILVALVVIAAVAIPMWNTRQLRERRAEGMDALLAVQAAQDRHFGAHAAYAEDAKLHAQPPEGLGVARTTRNHSYAIEVRRSEDGLDYLAIARAIPREQPDTRCAELRLDQHGRRSALNAEGEDSTADCWTRY